MKDLLKRRFALPVIAGLGVFLMILLVKLQPEKVHTPPDQKAKPVKTITLTKQSLRPTIIGYGSVTPDYKLAAKAEVTGRITFVHPELKKGAILKAGTLVMKIDDKDYQLALKQAQADLLANQANLKEMELNVENTQLELELAKEKLKVREKELKRLEKLSKSGSVSRSNLNNEKQNYLQQKQEVQQLENKLATQPSNIEVLKAQIAISEAKVTQSQRDLERTQVYLPFNGRISQVYTEQEQYITTGAQMFDAISLQKVVINAQFPFEQFRHIADKFDKEKLANVDLTNIPNMSELLASLGMSAEVKIAGSTYQGWQARVERISDNLDPNSRTIGVIVSVEDSYQKNRPGERPPLLEGMYMQVTLKGAQGEYLVAPRSALHENQFYRVNTEQKLERVNVSDVLLQGELALVQSILSENDKIITSDVFPAVNGMPLATEEDLVAKQAMQQWVEAAQ
ncbi:efflux RND transporter periplasmic adaptor subunit [Pleionea sp. CnH1-48]|uniref:efflux RND transporter periplasmic adaptor subunit n=1 Tax=Pleionea sp. CnH1-48 TaxID=2954494 RepID=UPI0020975CAF|nr:hypothetical protein [Pleionea sp. CnH1-48]MCO7226192.1 hypothetical protein [Pleionea sp. CnH1-48]